MVERAKRARFFAGAAFSPEELHRAASRLADNLRACSCGLCCNPRRGGTFDKPRVTRQELRAELALREQLSAS